MFPIPTALDHAEERAGAWAARGARAQGGSAAAPCLRRSSMRTSCCAT
jgi:hypothetical protein